MRQYSVGVLFIILGQLSCPIFSQELPSIYSHEGDTDLSGEIILEEKYDNPISGQDESEGDYGFDPDQIMDDEEYWKSIYGPDDVPEFEEPPAIDGHSIFMDLGDLAEFWDDEEDDDETLPVKRDTSVTRTSASVRKQRRNQRKSERSEKFDYRSTMSSVHQPHFDEQKSWRSPKISFATSSNIDQSESASTLKNSRRSESNDIRIAASHDGGSELKSDLVASEPKLTKTNGGMDSLVNSKLKVIEAKKNLVNVVAAGGNKAELTDALHETIEAKKDLIDSAIVAKVSALEGRQQSVDYFADFDHDLNFPTISEISGSIQSQGKLQSLLEAKRKIIEAKKDLINAAATGGIKADLADALHQAIQAKKDLVDSMISSKVSSAHAKQDSIHSSAGFHDDHSFSTNSKISGSLHSQGKLQSALETGQKIIQAKKDLIDAATTGGTDAELTHALHEAIGAKKDLIDSVISSKASVIQGKMDLIHSLPGLNGDHSFSTNSEVSGSIQSQGKHQSVLESKQKIIQAKKDLINVAATGGTKAELTDAVHQAIEAKKDFINSVISSKGSAIQGKIDLIHSLPGLDGDHSFSTNSEISGSIQSQGKHQSLLESKRKIIPAKKDLINAAAAGSRNVELTDALHEAIEAKKDFIDSVISARTGAIQGKQEFVQSDFDAGHSFSTNSKISGSLHSHGKLQSASDLKQKIVQAKKDLINSATTGGTDAELTDGLHEAIGAKKDLVDSVISSKASAIQGKMDLIHSIPGLDGDHSISTNTKLSGSIQSQGKHRFVLDSKEKIIQAQKDLIDAARTGGIEAELTDAFHEAIAAKKDLIDSAISSKVSANQGKKELIHSFSTLDGHHSFSTNSEISGSLQSQGKLQTAPETTQKIINAAATGGIQAELTDAVHEAIGAKKGLIDSVISSKVNAIQGKKELINSFPALDGDHSFSTNSEISGSIQFQGKHQSVLDSKGKTIQVQKDSIPAAAVKGSEVKLTDAFTDALNAKKDLINHQSGSIAQSKLDDKQFSSGITILQDKKGSLHSTASGTSNIAVGGEFGIASSSSNNNYEADGTLILNKKIDGLSKISGDLKSGSKTITQGEIDASIKSGKINFAAVGNGETKFTANIDSQGETDVPISASDSSSEEISDSLSASTEIAGTGEFSGSLNIKHISKPEVTKNLEIKSSINSDLKLSTNLGLETVADSDLNIKSTFGSGLSAQSEAGKTTIVDEKSILEHSKGLDALKAIEIVGTEGKDNSQSTRKDCTTGECGISGKLYVDLNTNSNGNNFRLEKQAAGTSVESKLTQDIDDSKEDEGIPKVDIQFSVAKEAAANINIEDNEQPKKSTQFDEQNTYLEANEDEESHKDRTVYVPGITEADEQMLIDGKQDKGSETITITRNFQVNRDGSLSEFSDLITKSENSDGELKEKLDQQEVVHEENEGGGDSIATIKSSATLNLNSQYSKAQKTVRENQGDKNEAVDRNTRYEVSVKIGDDEDHQKTQEESYEKHYSYAGQDRQVSQNQKMVSHFQSVDGSFNTHHDDDNDYYKIDGSFSNAHCRLINLDVNCSGMTAFMKPECQQLNLNLWHPRDSGTPITLRTVKRYLSHGQELAIEMQNRAKWLYDKGLIPKLHTPAMLHLINNLATENTVEINQESEFSLFGTKLLQYRLSSDFDVTPNTFLEFLQHHAFRVIGTGLCHVREKRCPDNQNYRSFDGSCNNQNHPTWGKSNTAFARILPARYFDGIHQPPKSVTGIELPNPRVISVNCFSRKPISYPRKLTLATVQFGQLMSHDFTFQTIDQTVEGGIECCADGKRQLPKRLQHHSCLPIDIPEDDKFYSQFQTRCMNFVRSMTISREDCTLGPADQLNAVTGYLDASPLYGSNKETCDNLRAFKGGRMLVTIRRGREMLPVTTNRSRFCDVMCPTEVCYLAGDSRVNQNPQLAITQTIFLREHNRIADELAELNPHWNDERVFQEARRIVIAIYQHIIYQEWLPLIIGKKYCRRHRLTPRYQDYNMSRDYDPRIKASTINSFATAAFRFFHSMVDGNIDLCPANRDVSHILRLSNHYFRPQVIERSNNLDDLIRGMVTQPMRKPDENFDPEICEYLFRSSNEYGLDLESIDIQRGRDHGLPDYNSCRKICGLKPARDFDDLIEEIPYENIEKLKGIYAHVNDIDLFVGIVLEKRCCGSVLGPVARCLTAEQFHRSKIGDRYFYSNADQPHPFTQEQFAEIKKASLARLLCDTGDNIEHIQPKAFEVISSNNPLTQCCALPKVDLTPWQELRC